MDATERNERYPWKEMGKKGLLLDAARDSDTLRFPYRSITVTTTPQGARARSVTVAPTYPPTAIGKPRSRDFDTLEEAMAWGEGIYDENPGSGFVYLADGGTT